MADIATTAGSVLTLEHIPLTRIRSGRNVRRQIGDVTALTELIRQSGLVQPIRLAPIDGTDEYELVFGTRRLAAAAAAGLDVVPALVGPPPERPTVTQIHENSGRAPLTAIEEAQALQEELDLGTDHDVLARSVGYRPEQMSDRVALLRLPNEVRGQLEDGGLSLADGLVLTRLVGAPEYLERALRQVNGWTTVAQAVDRQLREKEHDDKVKAAHASLEARGVPIVEAPHGFLSPDSTARPLGADEGEVPIKARAHGKEPCHAAFVRHHDAAIVYVCTDPAKHGVATSVDTPRAAASAEELADAARDKRSETIKRNRTLRAEHAQRRQDVRTALDAGVAPATAAEYILRTVVAAVDHRAAETACELLGVKPDGKRHSVDRFAKALCALASDGSDALHRIALAITLAQAEANVCWGPTPDYGPRSPHEERVAEYFAFAAAQGHALSASERKVAIQYGAMEPSSQPTGGRRRSRRSTAADPATGRPGCDPTATDESAETAA